MGLGKKNLTPPQGKSLTVMIDYRWWGTMPGMIAKDLLEILVCPACKQALEYRQNPESLKCTQCRRVYAVKDDIPIMLVDQATIEG